MKKKDKEGFSDKQVFWLRILGYSIAVISLTLIMCVSYVIFFT